MPALGQGWASGEAKGGDGALSLEASELGKVLQERQGGEAQLKEWHQFGDNAEHQ